MSIYGEAILLADSNEMERTQLKEILSKDYSIIEFDSGKKAIDHLNQHPVDIAMVIIGTELNDIGGIELLQLMKISKVLHVIPVIAITKEVDGELKDKAIDCGAEDIIVSPFHEKIILNRIYHIMEYTHLPSYKNVMEDLVMEQINKNIDSFGICHCSICRGDLAALALNRLPPRYVSTEKGRLISATEKMSQDNTLEIVGAIAAVTEVVKNHPRHPGFFTE